MNTNNGRDNAQALRRTAENLRGLAARGMKPRAYAKKAAALDFEAASLEHEANNAEPANWPAWLEIQLDKLETKGAPR